MDVPFSTAQFLEVFARYNDAVWPAPAVFSAMAATVVLLALRLARDSSRRIMAMLAFFWGWMGLVYHALFFTRINPAAYLFGAVFVLQGVLLAVVALRRAPSFRLRADAAGIAGAVLVVYALAGYPLVGWLAGQRFPAAPTFGLPCPTVIFTFGVLLWADRRLPAWLLAIPAAWAVLGTVAAGSLGMIEDYALLPAAMVGVAGVLERHARPALLPEAA